MVIICFVTVTVRICSHRGPAIYAAQFKLVFHFVLDRLYIQKTQDYLSSEVEKNKKNYCSVSLYTLSQMACPLKDSFSPHIYFED